MLTPAIWKRVLCYPSWRGFTAAPLNTWLLSCGFNYRSYLPSESKIAPLSFTVNRFIASSVLLSSLKDALIFLLGSVSQFELELLDFLPQSGSSRRPYRFCSLLYTCCVVSSQLMLVGRINEFQIPRNLDR